MVCQHTGACTWQILKNETHVYFISVTEIKYTWVFFYGSGVDEYAVPSYKDNQFEKGTVELYYALLNEIR